MIFFNDLYVVIFFKVYSKLITNPSATSDSYISGFFLVLIEFGDHVVNVLRRCNEVHFIIFLDHSISFGRYHFTVSVNCRNPYFFISQMHVKMTDRLVYQKPLFLGFHTNHFDFPLCKINHLKCTRVLNHFSNIVRNQFFRTKNIVNRNASFRKQIRVFGVLSFTYSCYLCLGIKKTGGNLTRNHIDFIAAGDSNQHICSLTAC